MGEFLQLRIVDWGFRIEKYCRVRALIGPHSALPRTHSSFKRVPNHQSAIRNPQSAISSVFFKLGDAIDGLLGEVGWGVGEAVFHDEGVFAGVLVVAAQHARGLELLLAEEELCGQ